MTDAKRLTAFQLVRQHPECRSMEPIYQCSGRRSVMVPVLPGSLDARIGRKRVRDEVPCGKAAEWRVFNPLRYASSLPPGWCTKHAAEVLRRHDGQSCPVRLDLVLAKRRAEQAWLRYGALHRVLREANTRVTEHDRTHACPMVVDTAVRR